MRESYLLKAPAEDMARWKAAAGTQPLAQWIRGRLNASVPKCPFCHEYECVDGCVGAEPAFPKLAALVAAAPDREFRPDFRGGKP